MVESGTKTKKEAFKEFVKDTRKTEFQKYFHIDRL